MWTTLYLASYKCGHMTYHENLMHLHIHKVWQINANLLLPQNNNRTIGRGRNINVRRYINQHFVISAKMMCKVGWRQIFVSENFWGNKNNQLINPIPQAWLFSITGSFSFWLWKTCHVRRVTSCGPLKPLKLSSQNEMKCQKRYPSLQIYHPINAVRTLIFWGLWRPLTVQVDRRLSTFDFR